MCFGLFHRVLNADRQACNGLGLVILQCEGRNAVFERRIAIGSADRRVAQRYRKGEVLLFIRVGGTYDGLGHIEVTLLTGVRERRGGQGRTDCPGIARLGCIEAVVRRLFNRIRNRSRQTSCLYTLAALQGEGRNAVRERHTAIRTADRRVVQRYREAEVLVRVFRKIGHDSLGHFQIAFLAGIGKDSLGSFVFCNSTGIARLGCCEAGGSLLRHRICDLCRQASNVFALSVFQREGRNAVLERHIAVGSADRRVA